MHGKVFLRKHTKSLLRSSIILLHLFILCSIWIQKSNLESRTTPKCLWYEHLLILLLLIMAGGHKTVFDFREKNNLISLFLWIRIKLHFPLVSPIAIYIKNKKVDLILSPVALQNFFSSLKFDHLAQLFVLDLYDNILIKIVNHLQLHKTWIKDLCAKLYQML